MHETNIAKAAIVTRDVILSRGGTGFARLPDIQLAPRESIALIGASGSGKTTALMALAGVHRPERGDISIGGTDLWSLGVHARDRFRGRRIGLVFQSFHLVDALSVSENIALAARCAGVGLDRARLDGLLTRLDIEKVRFRRADRISHGQAQRVAIIRALVNQPVVVLADEPTSALDDENAASLIKLLKETSREAGAAFVLATHDRRVIDAMDTVIEMERLS